MKKERILLFFILFTVGLLTIMDIYADISEGAEINHLLLETAIATSSFIGLFYLWFQFHSERKHSLKLEEEKVLLKEITEKYKNKSDVFLRGLSSRIDEYFNEWKLSHAERDITLFLLKGLTPKNIAEIRKTSEKTVRHQINAIYRKANFNTREELTAFFLEDLLAPESETKLSNI